MQEELKQLARASDRAAAGLGDRTPAHAGLGVAAHRGFQETTSREPHPAQIVAALRQQSTDYEVALRACITKKAFSELQACVLQDLDPRLSVPSDEPRKPLEEQQGAKLRENETLVDHFEALTGWLLSAALGAIALGRGSAWSLTSRALNPLRTLSRAIEQFGQGDLAVRAHVRGGAGARMLASAFNNMADRIEQYRRSSLGEMLCTQLASQAVLNSLPDHPVSVFDLEGDIVSVKPSGRKSCSPVERTTSPCSGGWNRRSGPP